MEIYINSDDFGYFYNTFTDAQDLRNALCEYMYLSFCRRFLTVFFSKRFDKVPTAEIMRIYNHFELTKNFHELQNDIFADKVSLFIVGLDIPSKSAPESEKQTYIRELKRYFQQFEEQHHPQTTTTTNGGGKTVRIVPPDTNAGDDDELLTRLLKLYPRNLKMAKLLTGETKDSRDYLLNVIHAIMKMEEPNNYPSSCIWYENVKKSKITKKLLDEFYAKAAEKMTLIEKQINQFKKQKRSTKFNT